MVEGRRTWLLRALVVGLALLVGCHSVPWGADTVPHGTYYTKFGLRLDRDVYRTTNYRSSQLYLMPVNTKCEVLSSRGDRVTARTEDGHQFTVENVPKHTRDSTLQAFDKVFSAQPVDLSAYSPDELAAIQRGEAIQGMTKDGVLVAMGPPPAIGTPSLDSNDWKYWNTRFTTFLVRFGSDGHVTAIGR